MLNDNHEVLEKIADNFLYSLGVENFLIKTQNQKATNKIV